MKKFIAILLGSLGLFMATAMVQEWDVFAPWLGLVPEVPAPQVAPEDRAAAEATVQDFLSVWRHLYLSGGDSRFAERLPAAPEVVETILADLRFLAARGLRQDMRLARLDITAVTLLEPGQLEVRTREYWITSTRTLGVDGGAPATRGALLWCRYRVARQGSRWEVAAWEVIDPPAVDTGAEGAE